VPADPFHTYIVAGLVVRSAFELPELMPLDDVASEADIEIVRGRVAKRLDGGTDATSWAQTTTDTVLLTIPEIGRFKISSGRRITVDPEETAATRDVRLFLLGSALGAVWFQRGYFPLHASVVVMDGKAVAFAGDPGAGKSTLAAWMHTHGHALLCDDVCVVRFDNETTPMAYPGFPRLKLWRDALTALAIDRTGLPRDYARADKFHLAVPERFWRDPVRLEKIFVLEFSDAGRPPEVQPIPPARAVPLLRDHTYRYEYISGLGLTEEHFRHCVRLAQIVPVCWLRRPRDHAALAECQRLIEEHCT
jgi:hypothetical protein